MAGKTVQKGPEMLKGFSKKLSVALVGAAALLLAACGGGGDGSGGSSDGESSGETRTIEHAMGSAEVPVDPERVVVLDTGELDSAMALGITPVGAVEAVDGMGLPEYLGDGVRDIELVGSIEEPNLEKIATLEPDLILSNSLRHESIYDQLSQIAPTVFTETTGVTWRENFDKQAEALNREDEANRVVADYEESISGLKDGFGAAPPTVSIVRFTPGDTRIYQKESFIGTVLEDAGLPRPEAQDVDEFGLLNVSAEAIPDMAGDVIFTTVYGDEADTAKEDITSDPLWQNLDTVENDRVYEVSDDTWMLGIGYTAANEVLEDLDETLAEDPPINSSTTTETSTMEPTG